MIKALINQLVQRQDLDYDEMRLIMLEIMLGKVTPSQTAAFITALKMKGETATEIFAAAEIMRQLSTKVHTIDPDNLVDPVGTGGASHSIFNVSTASSFVASCAGVIIAKHGSRAASSKSGSADLLQAAGVNIELDPDLLQKCIEEFGIGFMFAPRLHSAMKNVSTTRSEIGFKTFFNLLGPLTNPSGAKRQVLGVSERQFMQPLAKVVQQLGQNRVMLINSDDGLDEISIAQPTQIIEVTKTSEQYIVDKYQIDPTDFGIAHTNLKDIEVHSVDESLEMILAVLSGNNDKYKAARDMVVLNSAAIIYVADKAGSYKHAVEIARAILKTGQALEKLNKYIKFTQECTVD